MFVRWLCIITMILIQNTGWGARLDSGYELLLPFVDGMPEGREPKATLVDGGEDGRPHPAFKEFHNTTFSERPSAGLR